MLAIAIYHSKQLLLIHRYRERAHSYIGPWCVRGSKSQAQKSTPKGAFLIRVKLSASARPAGAAGSPSTLP